MKSTTFDRRTILSTLGLTAGSTLFPSLNRRAEAATVPKRFVIFYTYHGTLPQFWVPTAGTETDFTLNSLMKPYEAFKKDLVLLDSIDMKSWDALGGYRIAGNAHQTAHNQALSAIRQASPDRPGGPSIDQVIARGIPSKTKFPSLELGVCDRDSFPGNHNVICSAPGQLIPSEGNPTKVWNNVFKGFMPAGGGSVPSGAMASADMLKQKSVIDYVKSELDAVAKKLGSGDKARLDNHLMAIRDLENTLSTGGAAGGVTIGAGCEALPMQTGSNFQTYLDAHLKIMQMAFACDLTRVISLNVEELSNATAGVPGDLHDLAHVTSPDNGSRKGDAGAVENMRKYHLAYANAFNKVLTALTMTDADGKRLLDNTVVLWAGEIAKGSHRVSDCKWVLAGSCGGAIRTGRWLKCNGTSHQNLFVGLAQAMGVQISKFGEPSTSTGVLDLA